MCSTWRLSYLGVSMDEKGVTDHAAIARVRSAVGVINRLSKVGLNVKRFQPATNVKIFKTLIRTKWEYAMHLMPITKTTVVCYGSRGRTILQICIWKVMRNTVKGECEFSVEPQAQNEEKASKRNNSLVT